jgi:flagellar protein FlaI
VLVNLRGTALSAENSYIEDFLSVYKDREIIDFYKISENVYIAIIKEGNKLVYYPVEPVLDKDEARVYSEVREIAPRMLRLSRYVEKDEEKRKELLSNALERILRVLGERLSEEGKNKILYYLNRDFFGYGPIDPIYNDPFIEDITCSGYQSPVYVYHKYYEWLPTSIYFLSPEDLTNFARKLAYRAGQDLVFATPIVEGPLPPRDFRVHLTLDVVSRRGTTFTIRRSTEEPLTIIDLLKLNTITYEAAAYLWLLVSYRSTILIGGPMASGKTTLLNAISLFIPPNKKIVTIEETPELRLYHDNWTPLITKPSMTEGIKEITMFDLLKSSLRQRADYIIVGEIRGEEAYTLLQAVAVGHGAMSTIHAESYEHVVRRLQSQPMNIPKSLISLIDTVVIIKRYKKDVVFERKVTDIIDIVDYDPVNDTLNSTKTYIYDLINDRYYMSSFMGALTKLSKREGISEENLMAEYKKRLLILKYIAEKKKIKSYRDFSSIMIEFYADPDKMVEEARQSIER